MQPTLDDAPTPLSVDKLLNILRAVDPTVLFLSPAMMRRLIKGFWRLPASRIQVPHQKGFWCDRQTLLRFVDEDELGMSLDSPLPPDVLLFEKPTAESLLKLRRDVVLLKYWQRLFHLQIHRELGRRRDDGSLTAEVVAERIALIGKLEFEEIRAVLDREDCLFARGDDWQVYSEFVAVFLGLQLFRGNLVRSFFPGLHDTTAVDAAIAHDVDAAAIFARTRPIGAPAPEIQTDRNSDEPHDYFRRLQRQALLARGRGDHVRAAVLHQRAVRVAPGNEIDDARNDALRDLKSMVERLREPLHLGEEAANEWIEALPALLEKADQESLPVEARILRGLQEVCDEYDRKLYRLDVVSWLLSFGRRPIERPLTSLRMVHLDQRLKSIRQMLNTARLPDKDRQRCSALFRSAITQGEQRLRERFRPILLESLHDVGLIGVNAPEQAAQEKLVEELLDLIMANGLLTFSQLRDAISRNQLKLDDVSDPQAYWRGDPLIRLDRRLSRVLDGVYQQGEIYLRFLERVGSLAFGTGFGRFISRNVFLPFGVSFVVAYIVDHLAIQPLRRWLDTEIWYDQNRVAGALAALILLFLHAAPLRRGLGAVGRSVRRLFWRVLIVWPRRLFSLPFFRWPASSWILQLSIWLIFKPLIVLAILWRTAPEFVSTPMRLLFYYVAAAFLVNSPFVVLAGEVVWQTILAFLRSLKADLLGGIYRLLVRAFDQLTASLEAALQMVGELFQLDKRENWFLKFIRGALGVVWYPIQAVIRLYFIVLIEPNINPLKLPISFLSAKIVLPTLSLYVPELIDRLTPVVGFWSARAVVVSTWWLLPGGFGFLFWEIKETWHLFRANRALNLRPLALGPHGETMLQLFHPGLHSGTVPRLYSALRFAERQAYQNSNWRQARTYRHALGEIAAEIRLFVERELVLLLRLCPSWPHPQLGVREITLANNGVRLELTLAPDAGPPLAIRFEDHSAGLVARILDPGWLPTLAPASRELFLWSLAGLYRLAGVAATADHVALTDGVDSICRRRILDPSQPLSWRTWVEGWERPDELSPCTVMEEPVVTKSSDEATALLYPLSRTEAI